MSDTRIAMNDVEVWESENPTLAFGEPGFESDSLRLKVGDGVTAWNDLPYAWIARLMPGSEYEPIPGPRGDPGPQGDPGPPGNDGVDGVDGDPAPIGGLWSIPSPLGTSKRDSSVLLMSTYDTNPADTDHTDAITSALNDALDMIIAGVSLVQIIMDSRQEYLVGGAVIAGDNGEWAQIPLPYSNDVSGCIELVGRPIGNDYGYIGGTTSGTVIKSTIAEAPAYIASRGIASIFGGPSSFSTERDPIGMISDRNFLRFKTKDITIRHESPLICGIDCGWVAGFSSEGLLQFDRDDIAACSPELWRTIGLQAQMNPPCVAPQAIPVIFPFTLDWYGSIGCDTLVCSGWLGGPLFGEMAHIKKLVVFYTSVHGGPAIGVDCSGQQSRIDYFTDWDNAIGIASYAAPVDGLSTYAVSPTSPAIASGGEGAASPISIGSWMMQASQGSSFDTDTDRIFDVVDTSDLCFIDCDDYLPVDCAAHIWVPPTYNAPGIYSAGSPTGITVTKSIKNKMTYRAQYSSPTIAIPASNTSIRNPLGRDATLLVFSDTGAFFTLHVQGSAQGIGIARVPANGVVKLVYPAGTTPSWVWMAD